jgi:hypothetical protein
MALLVFELADQHESITSLLIADAGYHCNEASLEKQIRLIDFSVD